MRGTSKIDATSGLAVEEDHPGGIERYVNGVVRSETGDPAHPRGHHAALPLDGEFAISGATKFVTLPGPSPASFAVAGLP